jgi:hypothetical protein
MPRAVLSPSLETSAAETLAVKDSVLRRCRRYAAADALLVLSVFPALVFAQIDTPSGGVIRCDDGTVRAAYGIERSFVLGDPLAASADAASFSNAGGLVAVKGEILLLLPNGSPVARYRTGAEKPVLNIDGMLPTAIVWLPSSQTIVHWNGSAFVKVALTAPLHGTVTSIRKADRSAGAGVAELLILADNAVSALTIELGSGDLQSSRLLPGIATAAIQQKEYVVYRDERGLEFETVDGLRRLVQLPEGELTIERMASDWLHLKSLKSGQHWALHMTGADWPLSELPARAAVRGGE